MPEHHSSSKLVSKRFLAERYGVSQRTVNSWMKRRVLPYLKLGGRTVRFDIAACDIALQNYEYRSIFDSSIRQELERRQLALPPCSKTV